MLSAVCLFKVKANKAGRSRSSPTKQFQIHNSVSTKVCTFTSAFHQTVSWDKAPSVTFSVKSAAALAITIQSISAQSSVQVSSCDVPAPWTARYWSTSVYSQQMVRQEGSFNNQSIVLCSGTSAWRTL